MPHADIVVVGAGVVGLAVAAELARDHGDVYVLEKNETFGRETSSRNSGVIHSGIYYPEGSLKARLCVEGNHLLYELCRKHGIGHARLEKLIVATDEDQVAELEALFKKGRANGVEGLEILTASEIKKLEPNVAGTAAILSPSTGIIDAHALMQYLVNQALSRGAHIIYRSEVIGIEKLPGGYRVMIKEKEGNFVFNARLIVNCAGLGSDRVAARAGIDIDRAGYRLYYCKGEYFSVDTARSRMVKRLIFPVPPPGIAGVGIHVTFSLDGRMRLGPSVQYVDSLDYSVDSRNRGLFYESVRRFLPFIGYDDLEPEMAGIRPKLQGPGEDMKDFVVKEESGRGLPGLINLIGIESPGLTAAPAIARYVGRLARELSA